MNIYLDESYNLQRLKGRQFISINGFSVLKDKILRKEWKQARNKYAKQRRRIHANDSLFNDLREKSIQLLGRHDVSILSVFQLLQEISPNRKYFKKNKVDFEEIYAGLLKKLLLDLSLGEYKKVRIIIDSRIHKGVLGHKNFQEDILSLLTNSFPGTQHIFKETPSATDILVELADFISNTLYREYQSESKSIFEALGFRFIQIKNPL